MTEKTSPVNLMCRALCLIVTLLMAVLLVQAVYSSSLAYKNSSAELESSYTARILLDYVTAVVRAGNRENMVYVSDFEGIPCLFTREIIDGDEYITAVYCHEGSLKNLFCHKDSGLSPEDGTAIINCDSFIPFQASPNLLGFSFSVDGCSSFGYASIV